VNIGSIVREVEVIPAGDPDPITEQGPAVPVEEPQPA
jgi:hypothetical protein